MPTLHIERLGGLAGYGLPRARLRCAGTLDSATLPTATQAAVNRLFARPPRRTRGRARTRDGFTYRLTRSATTPGGADEVVEVDEAALPPELLASLRDELI